MSLHVLHGINSYILPFCINPLIQNLILTDQLSINLSLLYPVNQLKVPDIEQSEIPSHRDRDYPV